MSQGFVFGTPANRSALESAKIRVNLNALATSHAGDAAPAAPREGMFWLDTVNAPTEWTLKQFLGGTFESLIKFPAPADTPLVALFTITPAAAIWNLVHNFNRATVMVALYDTGKKLIEALEVNVSDVNQVVVTHASAVEGTAVVIG